MSKQNFPRGLIKPKKAIISEADTYCTDLVDQFQYELNTIFRDEWFTKKTPQEQDAFLFAGISTEGGEVVDCYKKGQLVRGQMDVNHLTEELGDLLWHISTIATRYEIPLCDIMVMCMEKYRQRWPHRYMYFESSIEEE